MKKFGAILVSAVIFSCSVEDDFLPVDETIQEVSAAVEIDGCESISYPFDETGVMEITNDEEFIYISVTSVNDFELTRIRLHVAGDIGDFPLKGKGNLPPGHMEYDMKFFPPVGAYTFKFPISEYSDQIAVASYSEFQNGEEKLQTWAGDQFVSYGNWYYFNYLFQECIDPCEDFDAGPDNSMDISQTELPNLDTYEVINLYKSLLGSSV
ncbi:hypothetical protein, partial [Salegentibacter sp. F14]